MKMMDYFKSMMVIALKTFPMMLIALLILPLLFAFINGYSQRSHSPKNMEYLKTPYTSMERVVNMETN